MSKAFDDLSKGINEVEEFFTKNHSSDEVDNYEIMLSTHNGISAELDAIDSSIHYNYYLTKDKKSYIQVKYDIAAMSYMFRLYLSYEVDSRLENIIKDIYKYDIKILFNTAIRLDMNLNSDEIDYYVNIMLKDNAVSITFFTDYDDFNSFESLFVKKVFKDLSTDARCWLDNIPMIIKFERKENN